MPLAGLSDAYRAALGKYVASGAFSSYPTLYDPSQSVWSAGGWEAVLRSGTQYAHYFGSGPTAAARTYAYVLADSGTASATLNLHQIDATGLVGSDAVLNALATAATLNLSNRANAGVVTAESASDQSFLEIDVAAGQFNASSIAPIRILNTNSEMTWNLTVADPASSGIGGDLFLGNPSFIDIFGYQHWLGNAGDPIGTAVTLAGGGSSTTIDLETSGNLGTLLVMTAPTPANAVIAIAETGSPTGGTYTLTTSIGSAVITHGSNQAAVQGVFDALSAGVTTVAGNAASFSVTFTNAQGNQPQTVALSANNLTGGTSPNVTIAYTTRGVISQTTAMLDLNSMFRFTPATATGKAGFFGATPVAQRGAYTQTYATASRTVPALTSSAVVTTGAALASYGYTQAQADAIVTAINALRTDVSNIAQVCNSLIDDSQALGFAT